MTAVAARLHPPSAVALRRFWVRVRADVAWLAPVLLVAGVIGMLNLGGSPQRIDDEGTYAAQAWAVLNYGELAHYTYWYDHPPLGWLQIAGYAGVTGAFDRYDFAVIAARESMVVFSVIATALVYVLGRRLELSRVASSAAALVFALSPLAVQFHRTVYLDNVAVPWLLLAFVLALARRAQLAAFAGSAVAFAIAVLSKETFLLALPILIWVMVRSARPETRRYTLAVAGSLLVLTGSGYLLFAIVKGELMPADQQVSLLDGVLFQLASRDGSGSLFDPDSLMSQTVGQWWQLDPVLIVAGLAASVAAVFVKHLRPYAVLVLALVAMMFRPNGYLPVPYVIVLLPFLALLIAGVLDEAADRLRERAPGALRRLPAAFAVTAGVAAVAAASPLWFAQLRGLVLADLDAPMRQAQAWTSENIDRDSRLIVDDAMWVDLVADGRAREDVVWYYKVDTDPAVQAQSPNGWRDADVIITTESLRRSEALTPNVADAIENSIPVATFGEGQQAVEVRAVYPDGIEAITGRATAAQDTRKGLGNQVLSNTRIRLDPTQANQLTAGSVDERIPLVLTTLSGGGRVVVESFEGLPGETRTALRTVAVSKVAGEPAVDDGRVSETAERYLAALDGPFAPQQVTVRGDSIVITVPFDPEAVFAS